MFAINVGFDFSPRRRKRSDSWKLNDNFLFFFLSFKRVFRHQMPNIIPFYNDILGRKKNVYIVKRRKIMRIQLLLMIVFHCHIRLKSIV